MGDSGCRLAVLAHASPTAAGLHGNADHPLWLAARILAHLSTELEKARVLHEIDHAQELSPDFVRWESGRVSQVEDR